MAYELDSRKRLVFPGQQPGNRVIDLPGELKPGYGDPFTAASQLYFDQNGQNTPKLRRYIQEIRRKTGENVAVMRITFDQDGIAAIKLEGGSHLWWYSEPQDKQRVREYYNQLDDVIANKNRKEHDYWGSRTTSFGRFSERVFPSSVDQFSLELGLRKLPYIEVGWKVSWEKTPILSKYNYDLEHSELQRKLTPEQHKRVGRGRSDENRVTREEYKGLLSTVLQLLPE